jgi:hypothetical protein
MLVVAVHVEAGAGRRKQRRVAALRQGRGAAHGILHVGCGFDRHAGTSNGLADQRAVTANQDRGTGMLRHGFIER